MAEVVSGCRWWEARLLASIKIAGVVSNPPSVTMAYLVAGTAVLADVRDARQYGLVGAP